MILESRGVLGIPYRLFLLGFQAVLGLPSFQGFQHYQSDQVSQEGPVPPSLLMDLKNLVHLWFLVDQVVPSSRGNQVLLGDPVLLSLLLHQAIHVHLEVPVIQETQMDPESLEGLGGLYSLDIL